jgi:hypothetical protein
MYLMDIPWLVDGVEASLCITAWRTTPRCGIQPNDADREAAPGLEQLSQPRFRSCILFQRLSLRKPCACSQRVPPREAP